MMLIDLEFEIGSFVYLKTDQEQQKRIVTSVLVTDKDIVYILNQGVEESRHYDYEISKEVDVLADVR